MESSTAVKVAADSSNNGPDSGSSAAETVVHYEVLRRDLIDTWPLGSVVTQGRHASVAAIWDHKDDPDTPYTVPLPTLIRCTRQIQNFHPCKLSRHGG